MAVKGSDPPTAPRVQAQTAAGFIGCKNRAQNGAIPVVLVRRGCRGRSDEKRSGDAANSRERRTIVPFSSSKRELQRVYNEACS